MDTIQLDTCGGTGGAVRHQHLSALSGPVPRSGHPLNRHQRRAAKKRRYSLRDFDRESAGIFSIVTVSPLELLAAASASPKLAAELSGWVNNLERTRPQCIACDCCFNRELAPERWLIARPKRDDAAGSLFMGACAGCCARYRTDAELIGAAADSMRAVWPGLRMLDAAHLSASGGRA